MRTYTRLLGNLGDRDFENEAFFVFNLYDRGNVYPEVEATAVCEEDLDECGHPRKLKAYRFDIDQYKLFEDEEHVMRLVPSGYDPKTWSNPASTYEPWFTDHLPAVAASCGSTVEKIRHLLLYESPVVRAAAYQMLVGYFGLEEFDSYPIELTLPEAKKRYRRWDKHPNNR